MGLFKKSQGGPEQERVAALLDTAMKYGPGARNEDAAQFSAAVAALGAEGQAAQDHIVTVARKGVSVKQIDAFWATVQELGEPMVPGVEQVLKGCDSDTSKRRAALALAAFADRYPAVRERCIASLQEAAQSEESELICQDVGRCLQELTDKGYIRSDTVASGS